MSLHYNINLVISIIIVIFLELSNFSYFLFEMQKENNIGILRPFLKGDLFFLMCVNDRRSSSNRASVR